MSSASSRNALDGRSIQRVVLYDGGGNPLTPSASGSLPVTQTKVPLTAGGPFAVVVASTSALVVGSNGNRKGLTFTNTDVSAGVISLGIGTAAVAGAGVVLYPQQRWEMTDYSYGIQTINAVAAVSGARLAYQEWM